MTLHDMDRCIIESSHEIFTCSKSTIEKQDHFDYSLYVFFCWISYLMKQTVAPVGNIRFKVNETMSS